MFWSFSLENSQNPLCLLPWRPCGRRMGSRRTSSRSSSGEEVGSNGRSCSYLSNVRPENRSTLCSVMAQLAEETQPSFDTTLKSRAVSENCNVKFSCVVTGHPTPQLTWYKDDMQLDRYCGLPKYEIFRNGKNHSLHIYNCTVDDAAIYQASASNTKGIVSCSGVLEVGEMNEFKIHQRYFGKLKQKAELRRREAEGKENQEPLRTISPDRSQRKRRSNMEEFLSTPSSTEDEGNEETQPAITVETETRLQEVEKVEEKPVANGDVPAVVNGQNVNENAKSGAYVYEPKAPFVKKKIKISNSGESEERKAKDESLAESVKPTEESMEVENIVSSSVLDPKSRNVTDRYRKDQTEEAMLTEKPLKGVFEEKERRPASVPGGLSGNEVKKVVKDGCKDTESPQKVATQRPSVPQQNRNIVKEIADVSSKSKTLTDGSLALRKTVNAPRESRTASQLEEVKVAERPSKGVEFKKANDGRKDTESPQKIATQRTSVPQQPRNFVKNIGEKSKTLADGSLALRKTVNAPRESRTAPSVAESVKPTEESMEVENSVSSPVVDSKSRNVTEQHRKAETVEVMQTDRPSKGVKVPVPSEKERHPASLSENEVKKAKDGRKDTESPQKISTQRSSVPQKPRNIVKEIADVGDKSKTLTDGLLALRKTVNAPRDSRTASSQSDQTRDRLKETSVGRVTAKTEEVTLTDRPSKGVEVVVPESLSGTEVKKVANHETKAKDGRKDTESPQKIATQQPPTPKQPEIVDVGDKSKTLTNGSLALRKTVNAPRESRMASCEREQTRDQLLEETSSEVTPAQTKRNRNDPPVGLELTLKPTIPQPPPRKSRSDRKNPKDETRTLSSQPGLHPAIDQTKQDASVHSQGSNEGHAVLFTDIQKSSQQSENSGASNVSYATQNGQMNTAINAVEGPEIQVDEKEIGNEVSKLLSDSNAEKKVELDPENAALSMTERTETEEIKGPAGKDANVIIVDTSNKETEKNDHIFKASLASPNLKSSVLEAEIPSLPKKTPELQIQDFQEVRKPETKVISVAELLRSQIKALESPLAYSSFLPDPTTTCEEFKERSKTSTDGKTETRVTLQTTLVEEKIPPQGKISQPVQALRSPLVTSPDSIVDTGSAKETNDQTIRTTTTTHDTEGVTNISQETKASTLVLPKDIPNFPASEKELSSEIVPGEPGSPQSVVTPTKASSPDSNIPVLEHVQVKDLEKLPSEAELNHKDERTIAETKSTSPDYKLDTKNGSLLGVQTSKSILGIDTKENHLQQELEDFSRTDSLDNQSSPLLKKRDSPIPSATPQELASGARRKILAPKSRPDEALEVSPDGSKLSPSPGAQQSVSPSLSRRSPLLQLPADQTSPANSPLLSRKKTTSETQTQNKIHTDTTKEKPAEKDKHDPFKAPQVIRKIRAETFSDSSGHLKLWCQFFNVLSDSTIQWFRNSQRIAHIHRKAGDESQVNLAVVQASSKDAGVYGCTITNEYGSDSTDCLLSAEILSGMSIREDLGVGEEIEMTPLIFSKGVADSGVWGSKFFGRIMLQESHIGDGCSHKVWRAKVIYGLEPVFESGNSCVIKVKNPVAFGGKAESSLIDSNMEAVKQECKIQNLAREYCKIFSAEARAIENFGPSLEVIPVYLMYRPANTVPYATVEAELNGVYHTYSQIHSVLDQTSTSSGSEVELKCRTLQHWIYQWTNGNLLLSRLEGVDTKITNVSISIKSTGHQGLSVEANPKVFERFVSQHQCNYFCGLLGLRSLKVMDTLLTPSKSKSSRSPLLQRKSGSASPQTGRKAGSSPRIPRKTEKSSNKPKPADAPSIKTD